MELRNVGFKITMGVVYYLSGFYYMLVSSGGHEARNVRKINGRKKILKLRMFCILVFKEEKKKSHNSFW